jgi:hypothetical protein
VEGFDGFAPGARHVASQTMFVGILMTSSLSSLESPARRALRYPTSLPLRTGCSVCR